MLPVKEILGLVYFTPQSDGTGEIHMATFTRPSPELVEGWSVVEFAPSYLIPFVEDGQSIGDYRIVFDDDGKALIQKVPRLTITDNMSGEFYQVSPYRGDTTPGIILIVEKTGKIKTEVWMDRGQVVYPSYVRLHVFITKLGEPNIILRHYDLMLGDVLDSGSFIFDAPKGLPLRDYSIWTISPGPHVPIWWTEAK